MISVYDNPVPSLERGRSNDYPAVEYTPVRARSGSAVGVERRCDIVYSPNKYRETEGIKEN